MKSIRVKGRDDQNIERRKMRSLDDDLTDNSKNDHHNHKTSDCHQQKIIRRDDADRSGRERELIVSMGHSEFF